MADFETVSEGFSVYTLPDGRRMRAKHVLTDVVQTGADADGFPTYNVTFSPVIAIQPSPQQTARLIEQARVAQREALPQQQTASNSSLKGTLLQ